MSISSWKNIPSSMLYYFSINVDRRIFVHFAVHFPRHVFILDKYIPFENRRGNILGSELGEREHCNHRTKDANVYADTCHSFLWTRKIRFCDPPFVVWWGEGDQNPVPEIAPPSMSLPCVGNGRSNLRAVYFRNVYNSPASSMDAKSRFFSLFQKFELILYTHECPIFNDINFNTCINWHTETRLEEICLLAR